MEDIAFIYRNNFGLAFFWKNKRDKIQVVFRNTGFYLSLQELKDFQNNVLETVNQQCCANCKTSRKCRSLLLKTPSRKIDLAVNREELEEINELLGGTIFKLEKRNYLKNCAN
ncbi:DUF6686 family protein [Mesonia maritima]|uniref:Uncharacterized protein n=1 Tax=Mesonia maritima TaxID=1793873 RepID=A0ABU1K2A5_9FLAO|nr:DUF6686 family protein [Mesonia maritima]MDR6299731.1 hypothetical protein [Mesonia maritima]